MAHETSWDRRGFLANGAKALVGATCLSTMTLRQIVLAAERKGCPALTLAALNERFAALKSPELLRQDIGEAQADLIRYLDNHFYLTPEQLRNIQALPPDSIAALNRALDQVAARNLSIRMGTVAATDQGGCQRLNPRFAEGQLIIDVTGPKAGF